MQPVHGIIWNPSRVYDLYKPHTLTMHVLNEVRVTPLPANSQTIQEAAGACSLSSTSFISFVATKRVVHS